MVGPGRGPTKRKAYYDPTKNVYNFHKQMGSKVGVGKIFCISMARIVEFIANLDNIRIEKILLIDTKFLSTGNLFPDS